MLADNILTGCIYYDSLDLSGTITIGGAQIYANNYEHSRIRAFLNGLTYQKKATADAAQIANTEFNGNGFLQKAFTQTEQTSIVTTTVVNNSRSTNPEENATEWNSGNNPYASNTPISDKFFLLSVQEASKTAYLFAAYGAYEYPPVTYGTGNKRIRLSTDYAIAKGAFQDSRAGYGGIWWLRSSRDESSSRAFVVEVSGFVAKDNFDMYNTMGVVPALCIN